MTHYSFEQFTATRTLLQPKYSPDGKWLAYIANTSGEHNLWLQPAGGGFARQLTSFTDGAVRGFVWSPDSERIAFMADHQGNEMHQLYVLEPSNGWPQQLTHNLDAQHHLSDWTPDGKALVFSANDREPSEMDAQRLSLDDGKVERLVTAGMYYADRVSPDGSKLIVLEFLHNTNQNIHLYDFAKGELELTTPHEGEATHFPAGWQPDGSGFYLLSNKGREYQNVGFYDLAAKSWDWVFTPEADVDSVSIAKNSASVIFNLNEAGRSQLYSYDSKTDEEPVLLELPQGVVRELDVKPDGQKLALLLSTPREQANLFELNLATAELNAVEQSMLGGIGEDDLFEPELISYPSFDRDIPAWLYQPAGEKRPVVVYIHGGPESQERPDYAWFFQYLVSRGIGVLALNIRGSTGYGISYQKLIHRDWGGDELKDIEHAAKYLQSLDWVDGDKLAVFGGSFGGFATLSALTRLPEYWAVGVDIVGPSNLITFVNSVPPHWKPMMKSWLGDPKEDADFLKERSPITYVEDIRAPLLVIQGANDPRVVKAESDQMVEIMKENGLEVEYYVDDEAGHGPTNREARNFWFKMSVEFLEQHLI